MMPNRSPSGWETHSQGHHAPTVNSWGDGQEPASVRDAYDTQLAEAGVMQTDPEPPKTCTVCGGTGRSPNTPGNKCGRCGGTGKET